VPSTKENVTVRVRRRRPREYLTEAEIEKLIDAANLMAYRHGLRASELVELRWDDVDFRTGLRARK
jgi:integrase